MITPLSPAQARCLNPLQMAFIGDAVYNLVMRTQSLLSGKGLHAMHLGTTGRVNAAAQAKALRLLQDELTPDEQDLVRRGRNAQARHAAPRSATGAQYKAATGFEALIGFLYLTGQTQRLNALFAFLDERLGEEQTHPAQTPPNTHSNTI